METTFGNCFRVSGEVEAVSPFSGGFTRQAVNLACLQQFTKVGPSGRRQVAVRKSNDCDCSATSCRKISLLFANAIKAVTYSQPSGLPKTMRMPLVAKNFTQASIVTDAGISLRAPPRNQASWKRCRLGSNKDIRDFGNHRICCVAQLYHHCVRRI